MKIRVEAAVPHYRQNDRQKNRTPPLFQDKPPLFITSFQANLHRVPPGKKNFSKKYPNILKQNLCQHHSKRSRKVLKWFRDMSNIMPSDFQCIFLRKLTKFHRKSHKPPKNRQNRPARHSTNWKKLCGFQPPQKPHTATFGISYRHPNPDENHVF
jgi:hypothetical protein